MKCSDQQPSWTSVVKRGKAVRPSRPRQLPKATTQEPPLGPKRPPTVPLEASSAKQWSVHWPVLPDAGESEAAAEVDNSNLNSVPGRRGKESTRRYVKFPPSSTYAARSRGKDCGTDHASAHGARLLKPPCGNRKVNSLVGHGKQAVTVHASELDNKDSNQLGSPPAYVQLLCVALGSDQQGGPEASSGEVVKGGKTNNPRLHENGDELEAIMGEVQLSLDKKHIIDLARMELMKARYSAASRLKQLEQQRRQQEPQPSSSRQPTVPSEECAEEASMESLMDEQDGVGVVGNLLGQAHLQNEALIQSFHPLLERLRAAMNKSTALLDPRTYGQAAGLEAKLVEAANDSIYSQRYRAANCGSYDQKGKPEHPQSGAEMENQPLACQKAEQGVQKLPESTLLEDHDTIRGGDERSSFQNSLPTFKVGGQGVPPHNAPFNVLQYNPSKQEVQQPDQESFSPKDSQQSKPSYEQDTYEIRSPEAQRFQQKFSWNGDRLIKQAGQQQQPQQSVAFACNPENIHIRMDNNENGKPSNCSASLNPPQVLQQPDQRFAAQACDARMRMSPTYKLSSIHEQRPQLQMSDIDPHFSTADSLNSHQQDASALAECCQPPRDACAQLHASNDLQRCFEEANVFRRPRVHWSQRDRPVFSLPLQFVSDQHEPYQSPRRGPERRGTSIMEWHRSQLLGQHQRSEQTMWDPQPLQHAQQQSRDQFPLMQGRTSAWSPYSRKYSKIPSPDLNLPQLAYQQPHLQQLSNQFRLHKYSGFAPDPCPYCCRQENASLHEQQVGGKPAGPGAFTSQEQHSVEVPLEQRDRHASSFNCTRTPVYAPRSDWVSNYPPLRLEASVPFEKPWANKSTRPLTQHRNPRIPLVGVNSLDTSTGDSRSTASLVYLAPEELLQQHNHTSTRQNHDANTWGAAGLPWGAARDGHRDISSQTAFGQQPVLSTDQGLKKAQELRCGENSTATVEQGTFSKHYALFGPQKGLTPHMDEVEKLRKEMLQSILDRHGFFQPPEEQMRATTRAREPLISAASAAQSILNDNTGLTAEMIIEGLVFIANYYGSKKPRDRNTSCSGGKNTFRRSLSTPNSRKRNIIPASPSVELGMDKQCICRSPCVGIGI